MRRHAELPFKRSRALDCYREMSTVKVLSAMICATGFLYQSHQAVSNYQRYDFSVVPSEVIRSGIVFPAITVCLDSWYVFLQLYPEAKRKRSKQWSLQLRSCSHVTCDMQLPSGLQYIASIVVSFSVVGVSSSFGKVTPYCHPVACDLIFLVHACLPMNIDRFSQPRLKTNQNH